MNEWPVVRLDEIAAAEKSAVSKPYGSAIVRDDYVRDGVPVVRGVNLADWRFRDEDFVFISEDLADTMPGSRLQPGDLVFTHRGSVGQVSMIPRGPRFPRYAVSSSQVKARLDPARALAEFYFYWFRSPVGRASILQGVSTVGVPGLARPVETIKGLRVPLPPLSEQRRIASVLGVLDDLIEVEERAAAQADELWRVVLAAARHDRESVPLSSLASFVNGKNFTKGGGTHGLPVIRTPEVRNGPTSSTVLNDVRASAENLADPGDILFVWSGSLLASRWRWAQGLVNQHIFKVIPNMGVPDWLVLWAIEELMGDFLSLAADKATTMGHIKRADLDRVVNVPARSAWEDLDAMIRPYWDDALSAQMHASDVAAARDELLPLLMSGRVRVSEDLAVA